MLCNTFYFFLFSHFLSSTLQRSTSFTSLFYEHFFFCETQYFLLLSALCSGILSSFLSLNTYRVHIHTQFSELSDSHKKQQRTQVSGEISQLSFVWTHIGDFYGILYSPLCYLFLLFTHKNDSFICTFLRLFAVSLVTLMRNFGAALGNVSLAALISATKRTKFREIDIFKFLRSFFNGFSHSSDEEKSRLLLNSLSLVRSRTEQ